MAKVKMLGTNVGVERVGKSTKRSEGFLHMPETTNSLGVVQFVGEEYDGPIKVGTKVYFSNKREEITMEGMTIQVMDASNIVAIVEEEESAEQKSVNQQ